MMCPACYSDDKKVIDSRPFGTYRHRRYQCAACGHKWNTIEITREEYDEITKEAANALQMGTR